MGFSRAELQRVKCPCAPKAAGKMGFVDVQRFLEPQLIHLCCEQEKPEINKPCIERTFPSPLFLDFQEDLMDPVPSLGPCRAAPDPFSLPDSQESSVLANPSPSHWNSSENPFFGKGGWSRSSSSGFVVVPKPRIGLGSHRSRQKGSLVPISLQVWKGRAGVILDDFGLFFLQGERELYWKKMGKVLSRLYCPARG